MSKSNSIEMKSSPTSSRSSSITRRTRQSIQVMSLNPSSQPDKRRVRSTLSFKFESEEEEKPVRRFSTTSKTKPVVKASNGMSKDGGRASMSSVSTVNDSGLSSGYSTPGTSVVATPVNLAKAQNFSSSAPRPRGRPRKSATLAPAARQAIDRARNLRTSEYSLNPPNNKRKRPFPLEDDDEDEDDSDASPDALLARQLQDEENRKVDDMDVIDDEKDLTPRRQRAERALRPLLPKTDHIVDLSDEEMDGNDVNPRLRDNSIAFPNPSVKKSPPRSKKSKLMIADSEESEFLLSDREIDFKARDSSPESEIPLATKALARKLTQRNDNKIIPAQTSVNPQASKHPLNIGGYRSTIYVDTAPVNHTRGNLGRDGSLPKSGRGGSKFNSVSTSNRKVLPPTTEDDTDDTDLALSLFSESDSESNLDDITGNGIQGVRRRGFDSYMTMKAKRRAGQDRARLEAHHPEILTMWQELKDLPQIKTSEAEQPTNISRQLKPFQLEGLSWMQAMEKTEWGGGLLGDEMGMGKTIQAVSLIMSDYPAKNPSLVLIPPVALMQWQQEIGDYTDGTLKTFVFHGTNKGTKGITVKELKQYDVILMSYNSLESMFRHQEKGFRRKDSIHKETSVIHKILFHRVILDEAHNIKTRTTGVAKACFALKADHKWCLSGTPLQNRIGEFFSLVRFLEIRPFACYFCKQCACSTLEWSMNSDNRCTGCSHSGMQHVSVFNQELLNPIQKYGNKGLGKEAFAKLRLLTDRFMLRRVKRDHSAAMELPAKEIHVERQFFSEVENDFAGSIMNSNTRKFDTYVANGVLLNNYANIFGLIMQMRQVADHPDLILKKHGEGGQNILVCCICDDPAEDAIRSSCRHDFCRTCVRNFINSADDRNTQPDCPQCHILLSIDLEQPEIEQDEQLVKKSSIINRIKMDKWTSSTKIESLVYQLHNLRSNKYSTKSIIFSQFTTMLQLVEWRLRRAGITTVMLDGSMTPAQRQGSINHFMTNVDCECFLVSLKAGGVALNLTEASHVFIVDPWWNPAAEWQSADRCHRIGQGRPCSITRLCIEDSVESRMVLLQEKKANMINSTINSDDAAMESLTPEDMQFLFRGN